MSRFRISVLISITLVCAPMPLFPHGITRTVEYRNAIVVTALYDTGEPISYASTKIFSPQGSNVEYQNGRTDALGRFAFVPSMRGEWLIRIDDGTGHGFEERVRVDEQLRGTAHSPVLVKIGQKIIVLLLLVWGSTMTFLYAKKPQRARKRTRPEERTHSSSDA